MAVRYYCADSGNGDDVDDPSEDALFDLASELNDSDDTFVVIQPDEDDPAWFASVAVLDEGGDEIVLDRRRAGVHLITPPVWDHDAVLPNPIGNRDEPGPLWVTEPTLRLLLRLSGPKYGLCEGEGRLRRRH